MTVRLAPLPPEDAIAALEARGRRLDPSWSWQDRWGEEHADAFTVARSAGFDILNDLFEGLSSALKEGKTGRDFARELMPTLIQKGWWGRREMLDPVTGEPEEVQLGSPRRLKQIFDANMRVSYAAGHWAAFERGQQDRPYLRYVALMDGRTRPQHAAWHNTVLRVDHPWWDTHAPPCGWNCRCTLQSLSARDVARLQAEGEVLKFDAPTIEYEAFERRDGTVIWTPVGIDPGWGYNPGRAGADAAARAAAMADRIGALPPAMAAAAVDAVDWPPAVLETEWLRWVDALEAGQRLERSAWTIGTLNRQVVDELARIGVYPSTGGIIAHEKQFTHTVRGTKQEIGKNLPFQLVRELPKILANPDAVLLEKFDQAWLPKVVYAFQRSGRWYKVVVHIDRPAKRHGKDGPRGEFRRNQIVTAGTVSLVDLKNKPVYKVILGSLGE